MCLYDNVASALPRCLHGITTITHDSSRIQGPAYRKESWKNHERIMKESWKNHERITKESQTSAGTTTTTRIWSEPWREFSKNFREEVGSMLKHGSSIPKEEWFKWPPVPRQRWQSARFSQFESFQFPLATNRKSDSNILLLLLWRPVDAVCYSNLGFNDSKFCSFSRY